jgi:hypothetical protein
VLGRSVRIEPLGFKAFAQNDRHSIVNRLHQFVWFRGNDGKCARGLTGDLVFFVQTSKRKRLAVFQSNVVWGFVPLLPSPFSYVDTSSLLNLNPVVVKIVVAFLYHLVCERPAGESVTSVAGLSQTSVIGARL